MKKLKGPDLKLPELRMPLFLVDLYYDLRDRRLLPLVALVVVAIVAVPFLLSGGSETQAPPPLPPQSAAPAGGASELAVVQSPSGLRDYRRRLRGRAATDPFKQRYTGAASGQGGKGEEPSSFKTTTESPSGGGGGSSPTATVPPTTGGGASTPLPVVPESNPPPAEGGGQQGGSGPSEGSGNLTLYTTAIDVRIKRTVTGPEGKPESDPPATHLKVIGAAALPGEKAQVVTYVGASPSTHKPLFMISPDVTSVLGEGKCLSGASACQLMELEVGMPVTFVYGPDGARYKITVLKTELVVNGHS